MNVYQTGPESLALVDRFDVYTVDLKDGSVESVSRHSSGAETGMPRGIYLGTFDTVGRGGNRVFRFIPSGERPEIYLDRAETG